MIYSVFMKELSTVLAQDIVTRTMRIIPFNVNVMDAHGVILASGDPARVGELHDGALLALTRRATVEVDASSARLLHGVKPGINLPLMVGGHLCGAVGLSGAPGSLRQFGELVRLTAEMILEQASLANELQRDSRYREALVMNLIRQDAAARPELEAWGQRLGIDFRCTQVVFLLEFERDELHRSQVDGRDDHQILAKLQALQLGLLERQPRLFSAIAGPGTLIVLDLFKQDAKQADVATIFARRQSALAALLKDLVQEPVGRRACQPGGEHGPDESAHMTTLTMGLAANGIAAAAISYQSAQAAARIGRLRTAPGDQSGERQFSYYALALPVLLSGLDTGWQATELRRPLAQLQRDRRAEILLRTLQAWFACDESSAATATALQIHRNTLDYRLRRIEDLTGLDLACSEHRLHLYVASLLSPLGA